MSEHASSQPEDPLIGAIVSGTYKVVRRLGEGGMGRVYEAEHLRLPKRAAVKVLHPDWATVGEAFERFQREAVISSSIGSRHIVQVHDLGQLDDGSPYMLMEYLQGEDLATVLERRKRLPPGEVLALMEQACAGVHAAHQKGVIHRDLKPANLFVAQQEDGERVVKVLDFGLSKVRGARRSSLTGAQVLGTPAYMSPEQIRTSAEVDSRTDVYALGATLFELLTGALPFDDPNVSVLMDMILEQPPRRARELVPALADAIDELMVRALAKDPAERFQDVDAFWAEAKSALLACVHQSPARLSPTLVLTAAAPAEPKTELELDAPSDLPDADPSRPGPPAERMLSTELEAAAFRPRTGRYLGLGAGFIALCALVYVLWPSSSPPAPTPAAALEPVPVPTPAPIPAVPGRAPAEPTRPAVRPAAATTPAVETAKQLVKHPAHHKPARNATQLVPADSL
ncbi:MAG: serine/threonine protein kinase [Deltaproteobacteria bacterium]|nr:serine/threonine protein kinase [Deltaproteobacteria bacterium]